jgi:hypothetical protein
MYGCGVITSVGRRKGRDVLRRWRQRTFAHDVLSGNVTTGIRQDTGPRLRFYSTKSNGPVTQRKNEEALPSWALMGGGALGLGLLAKNFLSNSPPTERARPETDVDISLNDSDYSNDVAVDHGEEKNVDGLDQQQTDDAGEHVVNQQQTDEPEQQTRDEHDDSVPDEPEIIVQDSHEVLGSIEGVLTKTADVMLREDAESLGHVAKEEVKEEIDTVATSTNVDSDILDHSPEDDAGKVSVAVDRHDSSSSHASDKANKVITATTKITASKLIEMANIYDSDEGRTENWDSFAARHKQAEADARTLELLLKAHKAHYEREIQAFEHAHENFKRVLNNIETMQQELLQAQADALKINHEKDITRERVKRQEMLDSARLQIDALSDALSRQSNRAHQSQEAHKISTAVYHIRSALMNPSRLHGDVEYKKSVEYLKSLSDDPIVQVATSELSKLENSSIKTVQMLASDFEKNVRRPIMELSYIPEGKGGMITSLAAKIATALKFRDDHDSISKIARQLEDGNVIQAADTLVELVQGTAASHAASDWVKDVKTFSASWQALQMLDARAACINSMNN